MKFLSPVLGQGDDEALVYMCPACVCIHRIPVSPGKGAWWQWNGDVNLPTFRPSIRVVVEGYKDAYVCHAYVTGGAVRFLSDCTHAMAGQTVPLPEMPQ